MNEWINVPEGAIPSGRVHVLDADKAHIKNAIISVTPWDFFFAENKWFYMTQDQFTLLLDSFGLDSSRTQAYADGIFIRLNVVGK
jgi:hypothetical protein